MPVERMERDGTFAALLNLEGKNNTWTGCLQTIFFRIGSKDKAQIAGWSPSAESQLITGLVLMVQRAERVSLAGPPQAPR